MASRCRLARKLFVLMEGYPLRRADMRRTDPPFACSRSSLYALVLLISRHRPCHPDTEVLAEIMVTIDGVHRAQAAELQP